MKVLVVLSFAILLGPASSQWFSRHSHRNHHNGRRGPPRMHNGLRPPPMPFPPPSLVPPVSMDSNSSGGHPTFGHPQPPMSVYSITTEESIYPPIGIDDAGPGGTSTTSAPPMTTAATTTTTAPPIPTTTTTAQPETPSTTTVKDENAVFSDHMIDILRKLGELTAKGGGGGNGTLNTPSDMNSTAAATVTNMADTVKFGNVPPPAIEYQSPRRPLIPMLRSRNSQMKPRPPPMWKNYRGIFSWKRQPNQKPPQAPQQNPIRRFDYNVPEDDRNRQPPPQMQPQQPQMPPPPRRPLPVSGKSGLVGKLLNLGRGSDRREPPPERFVSTTTTTSTTPKVIISLDIPTGTPASVSRSIEVGGEKPSSLEAQERSGTGNSNTLSILAKLSPRKPIMVFMRQEGIMETSWAGADPGKVVKKYAGSTKIQFFNGTIPTDNIPPVFLAPEDVKPPRGYGKIPIPKIEQKTETTTESSKYLPLEDQIRLLRLHRERLKLRKQQLEAGFYYDPFQSGSEANTKVLQVDGDQLSPGFYEKIRNSLPKDAIIESIEPVGGKQKPYSYNPGAKHNSNAFYKPGTTSAYSPPPLSTDQSSHSSIPYEIELPQGGNQDGLISNNELQKIVGSLIGAPTQETRVTSPYDIPGLNPPPMMENPNQRHPGGQNRQPPPTTTKPFPPQGFHQIPSPDLQNPYPAGPQGPPGGPGEGQPPSDDLFSLNMKLFYHKEKPRNRGPPPPGGLQQQYGKPGGFPGPQSNNGNNQNGGYNQGFSNGNNFNNGGYNGPSNSDGYNNGGYNQGSGDSYSNNGGYNQGSGDSYNNNGGYNQGSGDSYSNNGGYNQGSGDSYSNNGGYNQGSGDSYSNNGGYNNGGYQQGSGNNGYSSGHDQGNQYQDGSAHNHVVHPPPNGSPNSPGGSFAEHSNRKRPGYSSGEHSSHSKESSKYNSGYKNSYEDYKEEKNSGPTIILHSSKKGSSKVKTKSKSPTIVITGSAGGDLRNVNKIINSLNFGKNDEEDETKEKEEPQTTTTPKSKEYSQTAYTQPKGVSPVFVTTPAPSYMIVQNSPSPVPARFIINNNNSTTYMEDQSIPKFSFDDLFPPQHQQQQQQFIIQAQPLQQPSTFIFQQTPQLFPQVIHQQQSQPQVLFQVNSLPHPTLPSMQVQKNGNTNAIVVPNASPESPLPPVIFVPNPQQQNPSIPHPSTPPQIVVTSAANYDSGHSHAVNFHEGLVNQATNYFPGPTPAPAVIPAEILDHQIRNQHDAVVAQVRQAHHQHSPKHRQADVDLKAGIFSNPPSPYEVAFPPPERSEYFVAGGDDLASSGSSRLYQKDSQFEVEPIPTVSIDMNVQSFAKLRPAGFKNAAGEQVVEKVKTEEKIIWERRPEAGGMVPIKVTTLEKSYVLPNGKTEVESSVIDSHIAEDFEGQRPIESFEFFKREGSPTPQTFYTATKSPLSLQKEPTQGPEPASVSPFLGLLKTQAQLEKMKHEQGPQPIRTQFQDFRSTVFG